MSIEIPRDVKTFGEAVRYLREAKGLSLRALAKQIGVSAPFLSDVEHDRRMTKRIDVFARELGVDRSVLDAYDPRGPIDLVRWMDGDVDLIELLREMRDSGWSVERFRSSLTNLLDSR